MDIKTTTVSGQVHQKAAPGTKPAVYLDGAASVSEHDFICKLKIYFASVLEICVSYIYLLVRLRTSSIFSVDRLVTFKSSTTGCTFSKPVEASFNRTQRCGRRGRVLGRITGCPRSTNRRRTLIPGLLRGGGRVE